MHVLAVRSRRCARVMACPGLAQSPSTLPLGVFSFQYTLLKQGNPTKPL